MSRDLKTRVEGDVLWVTASGSRSKPTILSMAEEIAAACAQQGLRKVLIDVRALEGTLATIDSYEIISEWFPYIREKAAISHCAIVDRPEIVGGYSFFETVAVNRGYRIRLFSSPEEGLAWLKGS
jgi:hypothetical protein